MDNHDRSNEKDVQDAAAQRRRSLAAARGFAVSWGLPLLAAAVAVLAINLILPDQFSSAFAVFSFAFYWLPFAVLWIASGSTLISIAVWLIPAIALSAAWALGAGPGIGWLMASLTAGLLVISFYPPAIERWGIAVSRLGTALVRMSLSQGDREVDVEAERIRRRLWVAGHEARRSGPDRYLSALDGIRTAAEDLPSRDVGTAQLRRTLLGYIDALHNRGSGSSATTEVGEALDDYLDQLHRCRSRSMVYRIMTLRRNTGN